ncbi:MAG: hypothetical protein KAH08_08555 [Methylococcales bacterium]|nr:hypothetical protein [Methylococcales bacterium]
MKLALFDFYDHDYTVPDTYEAIYAYGDSHGDDEMLNLADHKYYQFFE